MMKILVEGITMELQKVKYEDVSPVRAVSGSQQHEIEVPLFSEAQALSAQR
jgi:hypothetical protein